MEPKITPRTVEILKNGQDVSGHYGYAFPTANSASGLVYNEVPAAQTDTLKVALIGTAPSSRMLAPFSDTTWKVWACSPGNMGSLPRVDAWFEMHKNLLRPDCISYGGPYIEWLKKQPFPVYMQDQELVQNAKIYPINKAIEEFGYDFWTSSFSYMIAFAILEGAREISLYGIDMASPGEYASQRASFYFFKREAQKRGIKIYAPYESDIMQPPPMYGYSEHTPFGSKMVARRAELIGRIGGLDKQLQDINQQIAYLKGALEDVDYALSIWGGVGDYLLQTAVREDPLTKLPSIPVAKLVSVSEGQVTTQPSASPVADCTVGD